MLKVRVARAGAMARRFRSDFCATFMTVSWLRIESPSRRCLPILGCNGAVFRSAHLFPTIISPLVASPGAVFSARALTISPPNASRPNLRLMISTPQAPGKRRAMADILIVAATLHNRVQFTRGSYLARSLRRLAFDHRIGSTIAYRNTNGLPWVFNRQILAKNKNRI